MIPQRHRELVGKGWWAGPDCWDQQGATVLWSSPGAHRAGPQRWARKGTGAGSRAGLELPAGETPHPPNRGDGGLACGVRTLAQQVTRCGERLGKIPAAVRAWAGRPFEKSLRGGPGGSRSVFATLAGRGSPGRGS